jgi:hypothetical protein
VTLVVAPSPQLSVALDAVHDIGASGGVTYGDAQVIEGGVSSTSVSDWVQESEVFSEQSETLQVAVVVPGASSVSSSGSHVPERSPSQASVPETDGVSEALHTPSCSDVFTVELSPQVALGLAVSSTVIDAVHMSEPSMLVAVYVTSWELSASHAKGYDASPSDVMSASQVAVAAPSVFSPAPSTHSTVTPLGQVISGTQVVVHGGPQVLPHVDVPHVAAPQSSVM